MRELVIDSFAGGGGASEGIRAALGRSPDIATANDVIAARAGEQTTAKGISHE